MVGAGVDEDCIDFVGIVFGAVGLDRVDVLQMREIGAGARREVRVYFHGDDAPFRAHDVREDRAVIAGAAAYVHHAVTAFQFERIEP